MSKRRVFLSIGVGILAMALFLLLAIPGSDSRQPDPSPSATPTLAPETVAKAYVGTLACLPRKGNGPATADCAIGLKTADGKYYAIIDSSAAGTSALQQTSGTPIKVIGKLKSDTTISAKYDVAGVIEVTEPIVVN